jgi:hypothetical protein
MASTVNVKNISLQTSEKEVKDFFSFCGKITKLDLTPTGEATQSATVTFEKETAAKTALLLDNTQLGSTQVQVSSASAHSDDSHYTSNNERDTDEITQEEKPRSRIVAEYLAHGYVIGDKAIQQAIDLDHKHGVSNRFVNTITGLNQKYKVDEKAKSVDQSYGVTTKTTSLWSGLTSYYEKAAGTPTGQKLVNFYTQTSREVQDIHAEARRLADLKKQEAGEATTSADKTTCKCGAHSDSGTCSCEKGKCNCSGTDKSKSDLKTVPGTDKTTCNCGGSTEACPCDPGHCACSSCPKAKVTTADLKKVPGTEKTTCNCGGSTDVCPCAPGECACDSCPKATTEKVANSDKTICKCGGDDKNCPCEAGKCACSGCSK